MLFVSVGQYRFNNRKGTIESQSEVALEEVTSGVKVVEVRSFDTQSERGERVTLKRYKP
jgi:hypothetical protein